MTPVLAAESEGGNQPEENADDENQAGSEPATFRPGVGLGRPGWFTREALICRVNRRNDLSGVEDWPWKARFQFHRLLQRGSAFPVRPV